MPYYPPNSGGGGGGGINDVNGQTTSTVVVDAASVGGVTVAPINQIFASPASGSSGAMTVRGMVAADLCVVPITKGGHGQVTAGAGFNALSPITALGDIIYGSAANVNSALAGNTSTTKKFLSQTGTGSASAAPAWVVLGVADIPNLPATIITSGVLSAQNGGSGQDGSAAANGAILIGTGTGFALAVPSQGTGITITAASGSLTFGITATAVTAASYGSASSVGTFTVNAQGQLTAAATVAIALAGSAITSGLVGTTVGGTGVNNAGTITNATNTTITGGGTLALGGFTLTVPATGTAALLSAGNAFTGANTFGTAVTPIAITGGAGTSIAPPTQFSYVGGAHIALTAGSVGTSEVVIDLSTPKQWTGGTTVTNYIGMRIKSPNVTATSATTFTSLTTLQVDVPTAGTNAAASGALAISTSGSLQVAGTIIGKSAPQVLALAQSSASSGLAQIISITGAAQTGQTASTEAINVIFNLGQTVQHATGALATQRTIVIQPATYSFVGASNLTDTATFAVQGPPVAGTNATLVNQPSAIWAQAGQIRTDGNFMMSSAAAPAILQNGQFWLDSTQLSFMARIGGLSQSLASVMFTATADATVANTTTETTILGSGVGSKTIQANTLSVGKTYRITVRGNLSTTAAPSLRIRVKYGSTVLLDTTAITTVGTLTNAYFSTVSIITCRTTGATGTVAVSGDTEYDNGTTRQATGAVNTSTVTIDTTASSALDVMATWGAASSSNTITGQAVIIEVLN